MISEKWTKCCRFDRFVRFVKWKSLLSIRQVRSSIGQLHRSENCISLARSGQSAVDSIGSFDLSNGKVSYRFDKCGRRSDNCISLVTTATRCMIVESIDSFDWWEWLFHSRFHIKNLSNRRIHLNDDYKQMFRKNVGDNKQEQAKTRTSLICVPRSLSVRDSMTRVGRKKLTIQGPVWSESVGDNSKSVDDNKQAKYVYLVL